MATKPTLSRELLWIPLGNLNTDANNLQIHQIAFVEPPGVAPAELDWLEATVVADEGHPLWDSGPGSPALAIMVGPARGDTVDTTDLTDGDYQVWVDVSVDPSGERVVRPSGVLTINPTGV